MSGSGNAQNKNEFTEGNFEFNTKKNKFFVFRNTNPKYGKREVELRRLPVEYWTPILHKLKADGKLNIDESNGCKL